MLFRHLNNINISNLENDLISRGISDDKLELIKKSKICIIDDGVKDLKSLFNSLKIEGFSNIEKKKICPSINELLNQKFELIILDLNNVATSLSEDDGFGILKILKETKPSLAIFVVTGQNIPPDKTCITGKADLVRKKPVLASDLAHDVIQIMIKKYDKFWAGLLIIKELNEIDTELKKELGFIQKIRYGLKRKAIEKRLINRKDDIIPKIENLFNFIKFTGSITQKIEAILEFIVKND